MCNIYSPLWNGAFWFDYSEEVCCSLKKVNDAAVRIRQVVIVSKVQLFNIQITEQTGWGRGERRGVPPLWLAVLADGHLVRALPDSWGGGGRPTIIHFAYCKQKSFKHRRLTQHDILPGLAGSRHLTPLEAEAYGTVHYPDCVVRGCPFSCTDPASCQAKLQF